MLSRILSAVLLVSLVACAAAGPSYLVRDGFLWHPQVGLAVPDLSLEGWTRVDIDDSDLAFRRGRADVIAMRVRCRAEGESSLVWESRDLWLGVPHTEAARREFDLQGREAIETVAESEGVRVTTVVVRADPGCRLDLAHVSAQAPAVPRPFEGFLSRLKFAAP